MKSIRYVASLSLLTLSALAAACGGGIEIPTATQTPEGTSTPTSQASVELHDLLAGGNGLESILTATSTTDNVSNEETDIVGVPIVRDGNQTILQLASKTPYLTIDTARYNVSFSLNPQESGVLTEFYIWEIKTPMELLATLNIYELIPIGNTKDWLYRGKYLEKLAPGSNAPITFQPDFPLKSGLEYGVGLQLAPTNPVQNNSIPIRTFAVESFHPNRTLMESSDFRLQETDDFHFLIPGIGIVQQEKFSNLFIPKAVPGFGDPKDSYRYEQISALPRIELRISDN